VADATLATVDLQWTAKIPLDEGLRNMLAMMGIV